MERVERGTGPAPLTDLPPRVQPLPPESVQPLSVATDILPTRGKVASPGIDDTLDLDAHIAEGLRRWRVERGRRWLMALPSADTTDQETRSRRLAEAIVDSAIAGMGGLERMQAVIDKVDQVWVHEWDRVSGAARWKRVARHSYWRGLKYRKDTQRAVSMGYDGRKSWSSRYGILRPAPSLRREAERWDFLSQFKGDGIVLAYAGMSWLEERPMHVVEVTDVVHGGEREAFFDERTHLLAAVRQGTRVTEYREYRQVGGILMPYERWVHVLWTLTRYRHEVQLGSGLDQALFEAPEPRSWDGPATRMIVLEHLGEDVADSTLALKIIPIRQKSARRPCRRVDVLSMDLFNTYYLEAFRAAGVAAQGHEDRRVEVVIEEYCIGRPPPPLARPLRHQLVMTVSLSDPVDRGWVWVETVVHAWLEWDAPAITDETGDAVTVKLLQCVARGLAVLVGQYRVSVGDHGPTE